MFFEDVLSVEQGVSVLSGLSVSKSLILQRCNSYTFISQTVALWLRNVNYKEEHRLCFLGLEAEAFKQDLQLFQRKSVYDILWGYTDPFLKFLIKASKFPPPFNCPGREGMTDFVQLQVSIRR